TGALSVTAKAPRRPDLVARRVEVEGPAAADPAGAVAARVRVANEGGAAAPAFDVTLCLATRERPEPRREGWAGLVSALARDAGPAFRRRLGAPAEEWELATLPLEALRPRESRQLIASVKAPPGLPRGRFRVVLRLVRPGEEPQDLGETTIALRATAAGID